MCRITAKVRGVHVENKRDPSNSLKRTWVQSKGNNKTAILGVTVGSPVRMNRDRRQHKLHSIIYLHILLLLLLNHKYRVACTL